MQTGLQDWLTEAVREHVATCPRGPCECELCQEIAQRAAEELARIGPREIVNAWRRRTKNES
jgi:hypothetical protein